MNIKEIDEIIDVQTAMEKAEDYITTIKALQAFISLITWDNESQAQVLGSHYSIGRRMDTSSANRINTKTTVTPDAVIQYSNDLGYIVEVKKSLPQNNNNYWEDVVTQLQEYDDELVGWWTKSGKIQNACVVFLVGISRAADFRNYLVNLIQNGKVTFNNPLSVVEFVRKPEVKEFLFLRLQWGAIEDTRLSKILDSGKDIPIERVIANPIYGEKKFYDAQPIVEHTMVELWQHIFTDLKQEVEFDEKIKAWPLRVEIGWLTSELQRLFGSVSLGERDVTFPRKEWVRDAINAFVWLGLAKAEVENENYVILFHLLRGDNIIENFVKWRQIKAKNKNKDSVKQLPLI